MRAHRRAVLLALAFAAVACGPAAIVAPVDSAGSRGPSAPPRGVRCMTATCGSDAPVCCESREHRFTCTTAERCEPGEEQRRYECTSPRDCAAGERCYFDYVNGQTARGRAHEDGIEIGVCETDADCPPCGNAPAKCARRAFSASRSRSIGSEAFLVCACVW